MHPSAHRIIYVTASIGSILELFQQILGELGVALSCSSRALITQVSIGFEK